MHLTCIVWSQLVPKPCSHLTSTFKFTFTSSAMIVFFWQKSDCVHTLYFQAQNGKDQPKTQMQALRVNLP